MSRLCICTASECCVCVSLHIYTHGRVEGEWEGTGGITGSSGWKGQPGKGGRADPFQDRLPPQHSLAVIQPESISILSPKEQRTLCLRIP